MGSNHRHKVSVTDPRVWTNIVFAIVGVMIGGPAIIGGTFLALGSAWMHYDHNKKSQLADWVGMYAFVFSLMFTVIGGTYVGMILVIGVYFLYTIFADREYIYRAVVDNYFAFGLFVFSCFVVFMLVRGRVALVAMLYFGLAVAVRELPNQMNEWSDRLDMVTHSAFHLLVAYAGYMAVQGEI